VARNAGIAAVAISCDQSLHSDASPMPRTVRFSQRPRGAGVGDGLLEGTESGFT
jgi:hypothetical protein